MKYFDNFMRTLQFLKNCITSIHQSRYFLALNRKNRSQTLLNKCPNRRQIPGHFQDPFPGRSQRAKLGIDGELADLILDLLPLAALGIFDFDFGQLCRQMQSWLMVVPVHEFLHFLRASLNVSPQFALEDLAY